MNRDRTQPKPATDRIPPVLRRRVRLAQAVLLWEIVWPASWPLIAVLLLFALSALSGAWGFLPPWAKMIGLVAFSGALLAALARLLRVPLPTMAEALRRLEHESGVPHRPATSYVDTLAPTGVDRASADLWNAHRARLAGYLNQLRPHWPRSRLIHVDPYALRVPLILLTGLALLFAGPSWRTRMASPFLLAEAGPASIVQIDAWISPPPYTGQAPIFLTGASAAAPADHNTAYPVPMGSEFVLRAQGDRLVTLGMRPQNGAARDPASAGSDFSVTAPSESVREYRATLTAARHITVFDGNDAIAQWRIGIVGDRPPQIDFTGLPETSISGSLKLAYELKDDYGIVAAEARFSRPESATTPESEPLVGAPKAALSLPKLRARSGRSQSYIDLTAHPWAGTNVTVTLMAEDDTSQTGFSESLEIVLPSRSFNKPLAKAIVEQRRILALTPARAHEVARALDALTMAPHKYFDDFAVYLAIRSARWRLYADASRDSLLSVVEQLWQIALHIENGSLSDAEQELRAARDALQRALAQDAPPEEIRERMQSLRDALDRYLQALADNARNGEQDLAAQPDPDTQALNRSDLDRMLDNIENMARNGARDQAQQLLSQLQDILENLRAGQTQAQNQEQRQLSENLQQLGELMNRQRRLMDETFRQNQQRRDPERAPADEAQRRELDRLQQEQAELQAMLDRLMEDMQELDAPPSSNFDDARGNMGDAIESLGEGETGPAASEQGEALENLRAGAEQLAERLARSQAEAGGRQGRRNRDPLGRMQPSRDPDLGLNGEVPDEIDIQRAREILRELQRRFGERQRPRLELDYFERLLRRF